MIQSNEWRQHDKENDIAECLHIILLKTLTGIESFIHIIS